VTGEFEKVMANYLVVGKCSKPNAFACVGYAVFFVGGHVGFPSGGLIQISGKNANAPQGARHRQRGGRGGGSEPSDDRLAFEPCAAYDAGMAFRTRFAYRIDLWDTNGENVVEHLAGVEDLQIAMDTYRSAVRRWPGGVITLRQGARVIEDSRRTRVASWADKGREGGR
jgi:hypothetical protein